ncbi:hypothetical protein T4B_9950 [Trichinella pseudospiralis]|uniref:Uncharacterized protein n=2 Tax=Trichinella pseudospiralis TaxID=6337 RepID=A0A0V1JWU2_TRIPS|nr:hypothetical protein T4D_4928 [Trichinella pseudospiralis]KRZ32239.1 hypothetical protein T4B_9950 [Trichinella pseudospiralis]KRZ38997.1 hypothetical protein T4C_3243 [Trichinella pseudospiralis]
MEECLRRYHASVYCELTGDQLSGISVTECCVTFFSESYFSGVVFHCKALNIIPQFEKTGNSKLQIINA